MSDDARHGGPNPAITGGNPTGIPDEATTQAVMALIRHEAVWFKITEPSLTSDGKNEATCSCGWRGDTADFRIHVARAALVAATPHLATKVGEVKQHGDWIAMEIDGCTCGTPDSAAYGYEPQCGLEPLFQIDYTHERERIATAIEEWAWKRQWPRLTIPVKIATAITRRGATDE